MPITIQNSYTNSIPVGQPGMLADGGTKNPITRNVEDAGGIAFGKAAFKGTADKGITATPGTKFQGIVIADQGLIMPVGGTADVFGQNASAPLLDMGDIWVTVGANVAAGAAAYVTSAGVFTSSASGNTAIPATFIDTASSGGLSRLRVVQQ